VCTWINRNIIVFSVLRGEWKYDSTECVRRKWMNFSIEVVKGRMEL